jgi:hypothetical protein
LAAHLTRRAALAGAAAAPLFLTGCKALRVLAGPPRPPADVTLLQDAILAEQLMTDRYRAALRALGPGRPDLTAVLRPVLGQHEAHLAQLRSRLIVPAGAVLPAAAAPRPAGRLPADPRRAVEYLRSAEQEWAARLARQLLSAPPSLAQLLASISASEASHVPVLAAARRAR